MYAIALLRESELCRRAGNDRIADRFEVANIKAPFCKCTRCFLFPFPWKSVTVKSRGGTTGNNFDRRWINEAKSSSPYLHSQKCPLLSFTLILKLAAEATFLRTSTAGFIERFLFDSVFSCRFARPPWQISRTRQNSYQKFVACPETCQ